jgi:hypothetical protein
VKNAGRAPGGASAASRQRHRWRKTVEGENNGIGGGWRHQQAAGIGSEDCAPAKSPAKILDLAEKTARCIASARRQHLGIARRWRWRRLANKQRLKTDKARVRLSGEWRNISNIGVLTA